MGKLGQIPTPKEYVRILLDEAGYTKDLVGKKVLENSCGDGSVLLEIVHRYIIDCKRLLLSNDDIRKGLKRDIVAYELDHLLVDKAIDRLNCLCEEYGVCSVEWNICCTDYLREKHCDYDFIIGNPPYITYHDLPVQQRDFLRENYNSCKSGRFDYSYAFIEKSISDLSSNGKLAYLIPFYIFRNRYADRLRDIIGPVLNKVIDYSGVDVFPNRMIGAAIIVCDNKKNEKVLYSRPRDNVVKTISKQVFTKDWTIESSSENGKKFGDYFYVYNSVATLKNDVFLLKEYQEGKQYISINGEKLEKELICDAVSSKTQKYGKDYKIIFPYKRKRHKIERFSDDELMKNYPNVYNYLYSKKSLLDNRKVSKSIKWFEYGRSQALNSVFEDKIIIPMIISSRPAIYFSKKNTIPFAGYYIIPKSNEYTLLDAAQILSSDLFYEYAKRVGTPTTKDSYRLSVFNIKDYKFSII